MEDRLFEDINQYLKSNPEVDEFAGKLITEEELDFILLSFLDHRKDRGITEEEAIKVVRWAENAVLNYTLFQLLVKREIQIDIREDGEFVFARRS